MVFHLYPSSTIREHILIDSVTSNLLQPPLSNILYLNPGKTTAFILAPPLLTFFFLHDKVQVLKNDI